MQTLKILVPAIFTLALITKIQGRSILWYLSKHKLKLQSLHKRGALSREPTCPIFAGIFFPSFISKRNKLCRPEYYSCSYDEDCGPGLKCCYDGCVYFCTMPAKPRGIEAIDWIEEPKSQRIGDDAWLDINDVSSSSIQIECSSSSLPGYAAMKCPSGYTCIIETEADPQNQVPNRGQCLPKKAQENNSIEENSLWYQESTESKDCFYKDKKYHHGQYFYKGCNFCFCDEGVVNCQLSPCPDTVSQSHQASTTKKGPKNPLAQIKFVP